MPVVVPDRAWSDLRSIANITPETKIAAMPIEATAFAINAQGQMELIGEGAIASTPSGITCSKK
jgi:hypothetical protein